MKKDIDWLQTVSEDDIDNALDPLRGIKEILLALELVNGVDVDYRKACLAISNVCQDVISDFEHMQPKLTYMMDKIREDK